MSPQFSPVYRLPFVKSGEPITEVMERIRYISIDRQLEAIFTFLGDGVMTGWNIVPSDKPKKVKLTAGSGVVMNTAVATNSTYELDLINNQNNEKTINYVYIKYISQTPRTANGDIVINNIKYDSPKYLPLGTITVNKNWSYDIDISVSSGRKELTLIRTLLESISKHIHNGESGEPSKIDLTNHVKGILSSANIEDIPASKITSGVFAKERFRLSHNDLNDRGTLTHEELDSLIEKFQHINALLFGDTTTSNLIQLVLSLKHVWENVDDYFYNFFTLIPGIGNNTINNEKTFIDINATNAEIDYYNHSIKGKRVFSKEIGQFVLNSISDFTVNNIDINKSTYDSKYIIVNGNESLNVYGWGYIGGEGLDYADILYTNIGTPEQPIYESVSGSLKGYGTDEFEAAHPMQYAMGYGWEEMYGFRNTLYKTKVVLNPFSVSNTILKNNKSHENYIEYSGNSIYVPSNFNNPPNQYYFLIKSSNRENRAISANNIYFRDFFSTSGDAGGVYRNCDQATTFMNWNTAIDMSLDNYLYFKLSQVNFQINPQNYQRKQNINFIDRRKNGNLISYVETFDPYWSPDVSMDLIIEVTRTYNGKKYRHFYKYYDSSTLKSVNDYFFFDVRDNTIFNDVENMPDSFNPATTIKSAKIIKDNLIELKYDENNSHRGGFLVPNDITISDSNFLSLINPAIWDNETCIANNVDYYPGIEDKGVAIRNITGVYLYTVNDIDNDNSNINSIFNDQKYMFSYSFDAGPIIWPQGQRYTVGSGETNFGLRKSGFPMEANPEYLKFNEGNTNYVIDNMYQQYPSPDSGSKEFANLNIDGTTLKPSSVYRESKMLVDLIEVYSSGVKGFRYDEDKNKVEDLAIIFTDNVDFNSLSWISSEPSNSIVYFQIKKLDDINYNTNIIYTNKGTDLKNAQTNPDLRPGREQWFSSNIETRSSGSDFPSEYKGLKGIVIKAVLLPTSDQKVTPVLNSIIVNYSSNTHIGNLTISSENQWSEAIYMSNIIPKTDVDGDYLTIDIPTGNNSTGKIKNLIYGSLGCIAEHNSDNNGVWGSMIKKYTGNGNDGSSPLPSSLFNKRYYADRKGIMGYVTCLKKMPNGDIWFLDQYPTSKGSRIIKLDKDYNLKKIIESDFTYNATFQSQFQYSNLAKLHKAVFNPNYGPYGVLFLVFTHELKSWNDTYSLKDNYQTNNEDILDYTYKPYMKKGNREQTINLNQFKMTYKGITKTLEGCTNVIPCGRGVLCFELNQELFNFINSIQVLDIKAFWSNDGSANALLKPVVINGNLTGSCVTFKNDKLSGLSGSQKIRIEKPYYDILYAPIDGTVSFDIDDDEVFYLLKKSIPYDDYIDDDPDKDSIDHQTEPWYVSFKTNKYWHGWIESTKPYHAEYPSVILSSMLKGDNWNPNFKTNNIYGERGSIEKRDSFLLMVISGEADGENNKNGVMLFRWNSDLKRYDYPSEPYIIEDKELFPMSAKFDNFTYDIINKEYGDIYIAISDLKTNVGGTIGKSKIIKVREGESTQVVWQWGSEELRNNQDTGIDDFAVTINDVFVLSYNKNGEIDTEGIEVIIST
jgi:hypothetical protein